MVSIAAKAKAALPPGIKRWLKRVQRGYRERLYPFTPGDLKRALLHLGIGPGDVLMTHTAFDRFLGFQGGPLDVIRTLQQVVGPGGTVVMPTIPFRGTAIEYARTDPVFDARRTASSMGLISEVFRRSPGVVRSIHPTHSVAAWGCLARPLIAGHEGAETPCGRASPYGRVLDYDGKILLAGVPASTMTFCYFIAEELEARLPVPVLTRETYALRWKDGDGTVRVSQLRLYSPRLDHDLGPLVAELKRRGQWRARRAGRLPLILLRARDVHEAAVALASNGLFVRERA